MASCFGCMLFGRRAEAQERQRLQALKELEDIQGIQPKGSIKDLAIIAQHQPETTVIKGPETAPAAVATLPGEISPETDKGCAKSQPCGGEIVLSFMPPMVLADNEVFVEVKSSRKLPCHDAPAGFSQQPSGQVTLERSQDVQVSQADQGDPKAVDPPADETPSSPQPAAASPAPPVPTETAEDSTMAVPRSPSVAADAGADATAQRDGHGSESPSAASLSPRPEPADSPADSPRASPSRPSSPATGNESPEDLAASLSVWETPPPRATAGAATGESGPVVVETSANHGSPLEADPADPGFHASAQPSPSKAVTPDAGAAPTGTPPPAVDRFAAFCSDGVTAGTPLEVPKPLASVLHAPEASEGGGEVALATEAPHPFPGLQPLVIATSRTASSCGGTSVCTAAASDTFGSSAPDPSASGSSGTASVVATPTSAASGRPPLCSSRDHYQNYHNHQQQLQQQQPPSSRRPTEAAGQQGGSTLCHTPDDASSAAKQRASQLAGRQQQTGSAAVTPAGAGAGFGRAGPQPSSVAARKSAATPPGCTGAYGGGGSVAGPTPRRNPVTTAGPSPSVYGSAGPRASPLSAGYGGLSQGGGRFVPLYGASIGPAGGRKTPPPAAAYSSASTRLALHDVLSRRTTTRSRGGGVGSVGLSVGHGGQLADIDFRPRWRY